MSILVLWLQDRQWRYIGNEVIAKRLKRHLRAIANEQKRCAKYFLEQLQRVRLATHAIAFKVS
jgi:hypothetical protein